MIVKADGQRQYLLIPIPWQVCYYRDKQSVNKFQVAKATAAGVTVSEPFCLDVKWDYELFKAPTKWAVGAW